MRLDVKVTELPNGVRVATSEMPNVESVAAGIWVGVGGRYESKRMSGVSHFIEHLLFKGTKTRSAKDISQAIEGRGGYFNAFTQEESTCYYSRIAAESTWDVFDVLSDMYRRPRFAKADIDRERGVILEEIMMYQDQPQHLVQEELGQLLWTNHSLGRPLIGTEKNILGFSRADIVGFKAEKYVSDNTLVVMAGKVNHDECVARVGAQLGSLKKRRGPTFTAIKKQTGQADAKVISKDIEQTHIALGVRLFGRHDRRRYPLKLMSVILGGNMSSRLFQVVREKHGLAYSVHSSIHLYDDTGVLDVSAGVDTRRIPKATELIFKELARLKDKPVSRQELRRAKDYSIGQLRIGLESTSNRMVWAGENLLSYGDVKEPAEVIRKVEAVTAADIQKLAGQIFRKRNTSIAMVTPNQKDGSPEMLRKKAALLG